MSHKSAMPTPHQYDLVRGTEIEERDSSNVDLLHAPPAPSATAIGRTSSKTPLLPSEGMDGGKWTFRVCVFGLVLMWLTAIGVIIYGSIVQSITDNSEDGYEPSYIHHTVVGPLVQLAVSFWVTALSEIAGLIHSTSLRFTLLASRRLTFNSNLRLFTSCPESRVHWWPVNVIWAWSLISSYACGSMVLVESVYDYYHDDGTGPSYNLDLVSGYALIFLGFGLLGQASIATWALVVTKIPSWSTNPIHTAMICQSQGWLVPVSNRTMLSVHDADNLEINEMPTRPKTRQGSLLQAHFRVRRVLMFAWIVTLLGFLWFIAVTVAYQVGGTSLGPSWGTFSRSYTNDWSLIPNSIEVTAYLAISTSLGQSFYSFGPWLLCKYLFTCVVLGSIILNLHVVELLVQCSRDESLWRQTYSAHGLRPHKHSTLIIAFTSWQTVALFVFKTAVNWLFSMAFALYWEGVQIRIPQVCYTAILLFCLAFLATLIALWKPSGPQPATFGHLPTLVDLIDVWPYRPKACADMDGGTQAMDAVPVKETVTLYWGDKGANLDGIRRAGTAHSPLEPIDMSALYL